MIIRTHDGEPHEVELIDRKTGVDYVADVINEGPEPVMTYEDVRWWSWWAENEQAINDTIEERGIDVPCFYDGNDYDDAQMAYAEYLGIELPHDWREF